MARTNPRLGRRWWMLDSGYKSDMGRQDETDVTGQRARIG
jgi:hypothetical protein